MDRLIIGKRMMKKVNEDKEYLTYIDEIFKHDQVQKMRTFPHHRSTDCLSHSIYVSYIAFKMAKKLGVDQRACARAGLLHDFYLYDWHTKKDRKGFHGYTHPVKALDNAVRYFQLTEKEKDIIVKHMWPLTIRFPRYRESFIVTLADKYCALIELFRFRFPRPSLEH